MKPDILRVKVRPNSRESQLVQLEGGDWSARLKSPPVEGKANQELIALIAAHFRCSKSSVTIRSGASGRVKLVSINRS